MKVQIFRLDFYHIWALEVVTERGGSLVWDELFETDEEALAAFELGAEEMGVNGFLSNAHWEICRSDAAQSVPGARLEDCVTNPPRLLSVQSKRSTDPELRMARYERH